MKNKKTRELLKEINPDLVLFENPSFDNSIVGIDHNSEKVIYSYEKMVKEYMKDEKCSYEDAVDFIDYNTIRSLSYYPKIIVLCELIEIEEN